MRKTKERERNNNHLSSLSSSLGSVWQEASKFINFNREISFNRVPFPDGNFSLTLYAHSVTPNIPKHSVDNDDQLLRFPSGLKHFVQKKLMRVQLSFI